MFILAKFSKREGTFFGVLMKQNYQDIMFNYRVLSLKLFELIR
jgi:hypothetical protein